MNQVHKLLTLCILISISSCSLNPSNKDKNATYNIYGQKIERIKAIDLPGLYKIEYPTGQVQTVEIIDSVNFHQAFYNCTEDYEEQRPKFVNKSTYTYEESEIYKETYGISKKEISFNSWMEIHPSIRDITKFRERRLECSMSNVAPIIFNDTDTVLSIYGESGYILKRNN